MSLITVTNFLIVILEKMHKLSALDRNTQSAVDNVQNILPPNIIGFVGLPVNGLKRLR